MDHKEVLSKPNFVHVIRKWSPVARKEKGYIVPGVYRQVLLNSSFTLCPQGHNPETFRIFEAIEAGSIPIVVLDEFYQRHECSHSFKPFIDSGAPLVYLNSWTDLFRFLAEVQNEPEKLVEMQANIMAWYSLYLHKVADTFEFALDKRFNERLAVMEEEMERGPRTWVTSLETNSPRTPTGSVTHTKRGDRQHIKEYGAGKLKSVIDGAEVRSTLGDGGVQSCTWMMIEGVYVYLNDRGVYRRVCLECRLVLLENACPPYRRL